MAISNFIPSVWRENLFAQLDNNYVGVKHCNREYEGDIIGKGSVVNIPGLNKVNVFNYVKGTDMSAPQSAISEGNQLVIDQAKAFNFLIDDVDRVQNNPKLMDEAIRNAAKALAKAAEKSVFGIFNSGTDLKEDFGVMQEFCYGVSSDNVIDYIIGGITSLYQRDVTNTDDIFIEVSPDIAGLIFKAKAELGIKDGLSMETGHIGNINGCKVYVSNNITVESDHEEGYFSRCFIRSRRAIAFAEQLSEINAYRPEKRFADAVKGLHLYGVKLVKPSEIIVLDMFRS